MSGGFRAGAVAGLVASNPAEGIAPTQPGRADLSVPTAEEVAAIVAAGAGSLDRLFLRIAALTGARRGEFVALQWPDVNALRAEVVIRRAVSTDDNGRAYAHEGKTGRRGHRVLSIDPATVEQLEEHRIAQADSAAARSLPAPVRIFSRDHGVDPWFPDTATDAFTAARAKAKIAGVRLYDFRHYVATSMLQDGEAPIDVANQLGDTVQTVLRTYAHFMPGRSRDAALRRAQALG